MIGIYQIKNKVNGKVYIGQSVDIERRFNSHKNSNEDHPLYRGFKKYGIDNFSFEIIEECLVSELNDKEIYYIDFYNSYDKGYNQTLGGSNVSFQKLSKGKVEEITNLLLKGELTQIEIAAEFNVGSDVISMINQGKMHKRDINYPIFDYTSDKNRYCLDCEKKITLGALRCEKCNKIFQRVVERPSPEWLVENIAKRGFVDVGKEFGVSDKTVSKWCKAYGLPHLKKDIVKLFKGV